MATNDTDKETYLMALRDSGIKTAACKQAKVSFPTVQRWLKDDAAFAEAFDEAMSEAADYLEEEARRRAFGVEVTKRGKDGEYTETRYSDTLLIFLLNGAKPDKFAHRNKTELGNLDNKPLAISDTSAAARVAAILDAARHRAAQEPGDDLDPFA